MKFLVCFACAECLEFSSTSSYFLQLLLSLPLSIKLDVGHCLKWGPSCSVYSLVFPLGPHFT